MKEIKGFLLALFSGATFGLIPLFVIPVIEDGMDYTDIVFYRFLLGGAGMLMLMLARRMSLKISVKEVGEIAILSLLYVFSAVTLFMSYRYIPSGVSTSLIYTNPIWCALITLLFLGGKLNMRLAFSLAMSFVGVAMLSGLFSGEGEKMIEQGILQTSTMIGLGLGLCGGLGYGIYLTVIPRMSLHSMPSTKLNFYIFMESLVMLALYAFFFDDGIELPHCGECWWRLLLLGIIPTAISNICLTMSLHLIDSTIVAILGASEPFTAMLVGIIVLNEPYDAFTITGAMLILFAVMILTVKKIKRPIIET